MKRLYLFLTLAWLAGFTVPAFAKLNAVACEPEWGALLQELGGDKLKIYTATTAHQDPHRVEPRPSLIARMRSADLLVCTGAELEIGWLPVLLQQASARVQPGQPGYFEAASAVTLRDKPARVDRALGDVHPQGNPHIQTDPRNIARVAQALAQRLADVDARNADYYRARYADFDKRWQAAIVRWEREAASVKGMPIVVHHKSWVYLEDWLGLREVGVLEPKPGVSPTTSHLAGLVAQLKQTPAKLIVRAPYQDARPDDWLAQKAGIPVAVLPFTVGDGAKDLFSLFDMTIQALVRHAQ